MVARRGMLGCQGVCVVSGGMHGCQGACVVAREMCVVARGACTGYDEIRSMSRWYTSYWNAFLLVILKVKITKNSIL